MNYQYATIIITLLYIILHYRIIRLSTQLRTFNKALMNSAVTNQNNFWSFINDYVSDYKGDLSDCLKLYSIQRSGQCNIGDSVPDPRECIGSDVLLERMGKRRLNIAIPGFLTAFGVLYTFIGIRNSMDAISHFGTLSTELVIDHLFASMALAFSSSIIGIVASIVWGVLDRVQVTLLESRVLSIERELKKRVIIEKGDSTIHHLVNFERKRLENYQAIGNEIIEKLTVGIRNEMIEVMTLYTNQMKDDMAKINRQQVKGMEGIVNVFVDEMNKKINEPFKLLEIGVSRMTNSYSQSVKDTEKRFNDLITRFEKETEKYHLRVNETSLDYRRNVDLFKQAVADAKTNYEAMVKESESMTKRVEEAFIVSEQSISSFEKGMKKLNETFDGVDNQVKLLEPYLESMEKNRQMVVDLKKVTNSITAGKTGIVPKLNDMVKAIETHSQRVESVSKTMKEETHHIFEELKNNDQRLFQKIDEAFENFARINENLGKSIVLIPPAVNNVEKTVAQMKREMLQKMAMTS